MIVFLNSFLLPNRYAGNIIFAGDRCQEMVNGVKPTRYAQFSRGRCVMSRFDPKYFYYRNVVPIADRCQERGEKILRLLLGRYQSDRLEIIPAQLLNLKKRRNISGIVSQ